MSPLLSFNLAYHAFIEPCPQYKNVLVDIIRHAKLINMLSSTLSLLSISIIYWTIQI
jgi:hypothetical protein